MEHLTYTIHMHSCGIKMHTCCARCAVVRAHRAARVGCGTDASASPAASLCRWFSSWLACSPLSRSLTTDSSYHIMHICTTVRMRDIVFHRVARMCLILEYYTSAKHRPFFGPRVFIFMYLIVEHDSNQLGFYRNARFSTAF